MEVVLSKNAIKHFSHLSKPEKAKIKKKLLNLQTGPLAGKKLEGELANSRSLKA